METRNGTKIKIVNGSNGHILTWGQSGQGKTYFLCRMAEKYVEAGKNVLIIDFSGSFTDKELVDKKFKFTDRIDRFRADTPFTWNVRISNEEDYKKDITDSFLEVFNCASYFQQALLEEAITKVLNAREKIRILDISAELKKMLLAEKETEETAGNADNIGKLLMRLRPYESIENFYMKRGVQDRQNIGSVTIIDISDYPEKQRRFLTNLFLNFLWRESYRQEFSNHCDVVMLDEMQFLSIKDGSVLAAFLREGRKKGFEMVLSTQFIKNYNNDQLQILEQAANFVIFRPTPEDCRFSAKIIDKKAVKAWEEELMALNKGEAVLKGQYKLEHFEKIVKTPIIIRI